jgi:hypothetical protein
MPNTARCKFIVASVTQYGVGANRKVRLETRYDEALAKEDRAFNKATPAGFMEIDIANPAVYGVFTPGAYVYVDVTPVEPEPAPAANLRLVQPDAARPAAAA